jgi:hypothetical protein
MGDGVRFCRIQCKYRSLETGKNDVKIPCSYVTNGFIVFLYIKAKKKYLYCFFASDVRQWPKTRNDNYRLALSLSNLESRLMCYLFDDSKVRLIEALIRSAETSKEFQSLVHGHASITLAPACVVATGECVGGERLDPPLDGFPLLAHDPGTFGKEVHTEDGRASVREIAIVFVHTLNAEAVAAKFGTTVDHVIQAVDYARKAGLLALHTI